MKDRKCTDSPCCKPSQGKYLREVCLPKDLDPGIRKTVEILYAHGIETMQSCEGGEGHSYPEPTIEFAGPFSAGLKALMVCIDHGFCVHELRRLWSMQDGEPVGPHWALSFWK